MPWPDADNCVKRQATTKGSTWVMAKLVGNDTASVTFDDISNTIDGGAKSTFEQKAAALHSCDTNGGQVGVEVNTMDPRYQQRQFKDGTYTNQGIHALNSAPIAWHNQPHPSGTLKCYSQWWGVTSYNTFRDAV